MKTSHKIIGEGVGRIQIRADELAETRASRQSPAEVIEGVKYRQQKTLDLGRRAAAEVVLCVFDERIRLAELMLDTEISDQSWQFNKNS